MAAVRLDVMMVCLVLMCGAFCTSAAAAPEETILKQASNLVTPVLQILNGVDQQGGVPIVSLKGEMQEVSSKARNLLSILPRRVLELMADLEQVLNTTDYFVSTPDADFAALTITFDHVLSALTQTQAHLTELVPMELTTSPVQSPSRWKRAMALGSCCTCCGGNRFCGKRCGCACGRRG